MQFFIKGLSFGRQNRITKIDQIRQKSLKNKKKLGVFRRSCIQTNMGVNGLWPFLRKKCPDAFREMTHADFLHRKLALDAAMLLTTCLKMSVLDAPEATWLPDYVSMVLHRLREITDSGAEVCIVLDGVAPVEKQHARGKRNAAHQQAERRLALARENGVEMEIVKALRATTRVTARHRELIRDIVAEIGFEVVTAPAEAEQYAAELCLQGIVEGVISEDGDTLVSGAPRLYRGLCSSIQRTEVVELSVVLEELCLTPRQFQWMAVLSGTDFHPGIPKIGPVKGTLLAAKFDSDDELLDSLNLDDETKSGLQAAIANFGVWSLHNASSSANPIAQRTLLWQHVDEIANKHIAKHIATHSLSLFGALAEQQDSDVEAANRRIAFPHIEFEFVDAALYE